MLLPLPTGHVTANYCHRRRLLLPRHHHPLSSSSPPSPATLLPPLITLILPPRRQRDQVTTSGRAAGEGGATSSPSSVSILFSLFKNLTILYSRVRTWLDILGRHNCAPLPVLLPPFQGIFFIYYCCICFLLGACSTSSLFSPIIMYTKLVSGFCMYLVYY